MLEETEGIVLHTIPYSESSIISHIYTKRFGVISCFMNNVRNKRSKSAYFRPLSIINCRIYHKKEQLQRIKDIEFEYVTHSIYDSVYKANIALFIGEFLYKLCIHNEANTEMYKYLEQYVHFLDSEENAYQQSHIIFLIQLLHFWGITPNNNFKEGLYFNKLHGTFESNNSATSLSLNTSKLLQRYFSCKEFGDQIQCSRTERQQILEAIIDYYTIHTHSFKTLETLEVLKRIFG